MKAILDFIVKHKIISIIVLSTAALVSGGIIAFNVIIGNVAKPPEMEAPPETFAYTTLSSLKDEFLISEEEKERDISQYGSDEGFNVYKRSFYNFLNTDKYRVITTGYTNVDTMGGILVNIHNEKKFDGTNYFMHLKSSAAVEGVFASMSNNDAMHYLYVTEDNSKNLATVKNLDVKDPSVVKRKIVFTEKDYVYNYGSIPYIACNFIIRENTVNRSSISYDAESGLYKVEMELKPVESTEGLIKQMHAVSGTDASYEKGSVSYTAYVDSSFVIRRADIKETYRVSTMGLKFNGESETKDDFYYEGDENFYPLSEDEKYDLSDAPVYEDVSVVSFTKSLSENAVAKVKENGVNADFSFSANGISLNGRLQLSFGDLIIFKADTDFNGLPVSVILSLDKKKSGVITADINGFKTGLEFTRIGDAISSLLPAFDIDLGGFDVGTIIDLIDVNGIVDAFGGIKGNKVSETVYLFEPNLSAAGIPINLPFKMTVENGDIISFAIDGESVMGTTVTLSLTPSQAEKDLIAPKIDKTVCDLSEIFSFITEKDSPLSAAIQTIRSKAISLNIDADLSGVSLSGKVSADFGDLKDPKVSAKLSAVGVPVELFYRQNTVYVKSGNLAICATVDEIKDCVSVFTDLNSLSLSEDALNVVKDILGSLNYETGQLLIAYKNASAKINRDKIFFSYGDNIKAEISGLSGNAQVPAPDGNFVKLEGLKPLLENVYEKISGRTFTINGDLSVGDTGLKLDNFSIISKVSLKDLLSSFNPENLTVSGTLILSFGEKIYTLNLSYVGDNLYAEYNHIRVKISRNSIVGLIDFIKENIDGFANCFDLSERIDGIKDKLTEIKNGSLSFNSMLTIIHGLNCENGVISLNLNDIINIAASVKDDELNVSFATDGLSGSISLDGNAETPEIHAEDYVSVSEIIDFATQNVNVSSLLNILKNRRASFNLSATIDEFTLSGTVSVDFSELSAPVISAFINLDGMDMSLYFSDGVILLKSGNVAISAEIDELKEYISVFTEIPELQSFTDDLINGITDILQSCSCSDNELTLSFKSATISLSENGISLSYGEKISATVYDISVGNELTAPDGNFVKLEGLKPLLEKINAELSTRHFTANGSIVLGNTSIRFENIKIINEGNTGNPTEAFDNGDLTLSGTVYITASGKTHKLFIHYIDSTLFIAYKDSMKVKLSRASLDYVVDLIKTNYKSIIERFNYSEIISAEDSLTKLKDYKITIGSVAKLLQTIEVEDGAISINLKAEDLGFTDNALLKAYMVGGNLALDVSIGDKSGSISLDNTPFNKPAVPTGGFIDLSGITGLAEAAVNAILKPSEEYYLSGSAQVVIPVLGIIDIDVKINMDASVRLVSDGKGGKKIEAVAHVSCYDTTVDISLARSYLKCGEGTIVYKDETFYITRVNKERKRILGIPTSTWNTSSTVRRAMTRSYFGKNLMSQIGFFMGLGDDILSKFTTNSDAQIEKCLKSYSAKSTVHTIVLDGKALTGSSELQNMTLDIGITNNELTSLKVGIPISVSILDMTATVNLTHNPSQKGNYTDINNLNPSLFGTVLK